MPPIRRIEEISDKWSRVTPERKAEYDYGVKNPLKNWEENAANAEEAWEKGVSQAVDDKRFEKGVRRVGLRFWQEQTTKKGPDRFVQGVKLSKDIYRKEFAPYRDVIEKTELPPKGPKGADENYERVKKIGTELRRKKLELLGITPPA
jgi:hypothetical protein